MEGCLQWTDGRQGSFQCNAVSRLKETSMAGPSSAWGRGEGVRGSSPSLSSSAASRRAIPSAVPNIAFLTKTNLLDKKNQMFQLVGVELDSSSSDDRGGKNNGFYVLYHNMKHGQTSSKDLMDFLRESCQVEETYSKLLTKLAKVAANNSQVGTFAPFWTVLKTLSEKLASLHMQLVHTWSDLMKDIVRYNDEQHKKHKSAKEIYHTRCLELERLKRESASPKDIEKSETKYKKAIDHDF
ncbi:FCHO2-like protein [Mya arenaria]|uniref:FCHO2-like protein n=1 Tax=Mya arenaria TaxID=6604 RepID=A0ABY7FT89_MYAAR|nr:FCHO2-like protein [Mya arenaria]